MVSSFRLLPLLLYLPIFHQVQARGDRGGPCRVQTIETLLVEPAKAPHLLATHYMATLLINVLFAWNANDEERAGLELGSSLRIWTSGSGNDNSNQTGRTSLWFEPFEQECNEGEISMIVKTTIPLDVPSIEMTVEKDGMDNCCSAISPILVDKRRCIDVTSVTMVITSKGQSENVTTSRNEHETSMENKPRYEEYNVTATLRPSSTNLARTSQRLPPTNDVSLQLYSNDVTIQDYTFWPEEPTGTNEKSHRLTFYGTVKVLRYGSLYSEDYVQVSATDSTMGLMRTCGEFFHAKFDGKTDQDSCL